MAKVLAKNYSKYIIGQLACVDCIKLTIASSRIKIHATSPCTQFKMNMQDKWTIVRPDSQLETLVFFTYHRKALIIREMCTHVLCMKNLLVNAHKSFISFFPQQM
jgi:hypothetical protein